MSEEVFIVMPGYDDPELYTDPSDAALEEVRYVRNYFNVSEDLLKLIGRDSDRKVIRTLLREAYERNDDRPKLTTEEAAKIVTAIHGLTEAYQAKGLLDNTYGQSPQQIAALRGKTPVLPYDKTDDANLPHLLIQTLAGVSKLEEVLNRAIVLRAHVALSN
jgi:hypothetical protein